MSQPEDSDENILDMCCCPVCGATFGRFCRDIQFGVRYPEPRESIHQARRARIKTPLPSRGPYVFVADSFGRHFAIEP